MLRQRKATLPGHGPCLQTRKGQDTEAHSGCLLEYHRLGVGWASPSVAPNPHPALLNLRSACGLGRPLPDPQEQWAGEGAGVASSRAEEGAEPNPHPDRERHRQCQLRRNWPQFPCLGSPQSTELFFFSLDFALSPGILVSSLQLAWSSWETGSGVCFIQSSAGQRHARHLPATNFPHLRYTGRSLES